MAVETTPGNLPLASLKQELIDSLPEDKEWEDSDTCVTGNLMFLNIGDGGNASPFYTKLTGAGYSYEVTYTVLSTGGSGTLGFRSLLDGNIPELLSSSGSDIEYTVALVATGGIYVASILEKTSGDTVPILVTGGEVVTFTTTDHPSSFRVFYATPDPLAVDYDHEDPDEVLINTAPIKGQIDSVI